MHKADKSNLMGYLQPRTYLTLREPNFSTMDNGGSGVSKLGKFIHTSYKKVRVILEKGYPLRIDCCDFRFADSMGRLLIVGGNGTEFSIYEITAYACAHNVS